MGIYCLSRAVVRRLSIGQSYGFDELMLDGIRDKRAYRVMPFGGFWLDLGRPDDLAQANENYEALKMKLRLGE